MRGEIAEALEGAEDLVADLGLDGDEIEGGDIDGAAGADALIGHVEELPVEVEAFVGAEEVAGEDEVDEEFFADAEGVELLGGDVHEGARRANDEGGHAGEAGGDGVGEGVAVEGGDVGGAEVDEGEDDDAVLVAGGGGAGFAEALGEHGEDAGGAFFFFGGVEGETSLMGGADVVAGEEDGVELHGAHDGFERVADFGCGAKAGGGLFFEAAEDDGLEFDGEVGGDLADGGRVGELDGADGLELGGVGTVEGVAAGGELVEDEPEGEDVGLDAGLAGNELLGRHVGDGAAAGGVGGSGDWGALVDGAAGVEFGLVGAEAAGEAEVEDLDKAAVGEHDVGGFEVAMEDAEVVGGGEAVGGLNAGGEDELEAGGAFGDDLVEGLARDVLHDDVGFFAVSAFGGGFADVVDGADVGVVDGGGEAGFAELGGAHLLNGEVAALEEFEDDGALEEGVCGEKHDTAAAGADLADELVLLDLAALHGLIIARGEVWMV